jgi:hypothetical protein
VRPARAVLLLCLAAAALIPTGCGKKGPPLAPILRAPGRAMDLKARRTGSAVTLTFTVPSANLDETRPADIAKVDLYAYTAMAQNDVRDVRRMKLVSSIPVRKPPEPDARTGKPGGRGGRAEPPKAAAPPGPGVDQGAPVTVTETLDASMLKPLAPDGKPKGAPAAAEPRAWFDPPPLPPLVGPPSAAEPSRFYVVYGVSGRGNRGGASPRPPVPLSPAPAAPAKPDLEVIEEGVVVKWAVPPGARLPYQEPADETTLAGTYKGMESAPALSYVVYLVPRPEAAAPKEPSPAGPANGPALLTDKPTKALRWTDTAAPFGSERCYQVRAAMIQGPATLESEPSPVACVTPTDTFPPPEPTALAAVAGEGAISLIWAGVTAPDLAGYLVLRAGAPSGALVPLFETPIKETTFRDTAASPGVRYIYAVVAVDRAKPANRSASSNTVEATAR